MKEIIKELSGWLLYIVLIIALTWTVVTFVAVSYTHLRAHET